MIMNNCIRHDKGFTLVELLVVMAISMFVLVAASKVMISMTTQFKQQTRISEKSIESGFSLELLRRDISAAGFGLPTGMYVSPSDWSNGDWSVLSGYTELISTQLPASLFDSVNAPPRMVDARIINGTYVNEYAANGSSYLIIRSAAVGSDPIAGKFFIVRKDSASSTLKKNVWDVGYTGASSDLSLDPTINDNEVVVVVSSKDTDNLGLVTNPAWPVDTGGGVYAYSSAPVFHTTAGIFTSTYGGSFAPTGPGELYIAYGLTSKKDSSNLPVTPKAPFNRVDYYVGKTEVPEKCAPETGVLYRAEMNHADGKLDPPIKVMDCVAQMVVMFQLDANGDGVLEATDSLIANSPSFIRNKLKRVDVYLVSHEGQFDPNYEYYDDNSDNLIDIGDSGGVFDPTIAGITLDSNGIPRWKHFRWRVYRVSESPVGRGTF